MVREGVNYLGLRSNKYWNKTYRYGCVLAIDLDLSNKDELSHGRASSEHRNIVNNVTYKMIHLEMLFPFGTHFL